MTYTGNNELVRILQPLGPAIRPARTVLQQKAVARAVTEDGYINPPALLPGSSVQVDFDCASHTASSSDTVTPAEYLSTTFTLFEGLWRLKARVALTGSLSTATNLNAYCYLNGEASDNFQIPIAAADRLATVFARFALDAVEGEVTLQAMFRPSAGTATIEAGEWLYRAERIR